MSKELSARIRNKIDTSANWATNNPVLLNGEFGIESDTNKIKVGNGSSNWNDLEYISGDATGGSAIEYTTEEALEDEANLEADTYYATGDDDEDIDLSTAEAIQQEIAQKTKRYLIDSWVSSDFTSGYDIYSDDYKEQWGKSYVSENATLTVTLPTPMIKDEYNVIVSNASGKTSGNAEGVITALPVDKTAIKISTGYIDPNAHNVYWQVKGY